MCYSKKVETETETHDLAAFQIKLNSKPFSVYVEAKVIKESTAYFGEGGWKSSVEYLVWVGNRDYWTRLTVEGVKTKKQIVAEGKTIAEDMARKINVNLKAL